MNPSTAPARFARRQQLFAALCVLASLMLWSPLKALLGLTLQDERYTHILVVPIVSAAFLYFERERIFRDARYCPVIGVPLILLGLLLFCVGILRRSVALDATLAAGALVLLWIGSFVLCYGGASFRHASFPLLFLLLIVPIPSVVLDKVIVALQAGSAEVAYRLFRLGGVPVFRHGMQMSLPGVDIAVAPQCSGIRSTMALFIAGAVLSRVLLRTSWARILTILCVGPIGIFRNAVRIVGISSLAVYVDRGFLSGNLHRYGGLPFSLVGFVILIPLVWLLRRWEQHLGGDRVGLVESGLGGDGVSCPAEPKVGRASR
jgi:exosortase